MPSRRARASGSVSAADGLAAPPIHAPIGPSEADALFAPLTGRAMLVAVSGGADSMALLWLLARWNGAGQLVTATIDHGLRPEGGDEAKRVAGFASSLGVPHRTLVWSGDKPATGIEAAARAARYSLLEDCAEEVGASHLVTAHTLDDQAETVLMRLAAGSGPTGLAAMRPFALRSGGLVHARPLLGVPKSRLIATLTTASIGWDEDAMNADPAFARSRLRASVGILAREGLTSSRLAVFAQRMARAEDALDAMAEDAWRRHAAVDGGLVVIGAGAFALPDELILRLLRRSIETMDGGAIRLERLEALAQDIIAAGREGRKSVRTLAGMRLSADHKGVRIAQAPFRRSDSRS